MIYYLIMVFSVLTASFSQILLKKASLRKYPNLIREYLNFNVIAGYALLLGSTILTIIAFRGIAYTSGPIIESLGYIFVMFLSLLFFKEKLTVTKIIGNALILLGVLIFYL